MKYFISMYSSVPKRDLQHKLVDVMTPSLEKSTFSLYFLFYFKNKYLLSLLGDMAQII